MMRPGGTPNFASTPAGAMRVFFMVSIRVTPGLDSCAMSLSPVEISTGRPCSCACRVRVAMTSSASTPSTIRSGRPIARMAWCSGAICTRSSSGMGGRWALYSG